MVLFGNDQAWDVLSTMDERALARKQGNSTSCNGMCAWLVHNTVSMHLRVSSVVVMWLWVVCLDRLPEQYWVHSGYTVGYAPQTVMILTPKFHIPIPSPTPTCTQPSTHYNGSTQTTIAGMQELLLRHHAALKHLDHPGN